MNIKTIIVIAVCVIAVLGVFLLLGYTGIFPNVISDFVLPQLEGDKVAAAVSNPVALVGMAGSAASIGGLALTQLNKVKQEAQTKINAEKTKVTSITDSLEEATSKLTATETNLSNATEQIKSLETTAETATAKATDLQKQLESLTAQNQSLSQLVENGKQELAKNAKLLQDPTTKKLYQASIIQELPIQ